MRPDPSGREAGKNPRTVSSRRRNASATSSAAGPVAVRSTTAARPTFTRGAPGFATPNRLAKPPVTLNSSVNVRPV